MELIRYIENSMKAGFILNEAELELIKKAEKCADVEFDLRVRMPMKRYDAIDAMRYVATIYQNGSVKYDNTRGCKVIFNPPATILFKDGKKYVSKTTENEPFDEEKGLAITLLKAMGISYADLKKLLKEAKRQVIR